MEVGLKKYKKYIHSKYQNRVSLSCIPQRHLMTSLLGMQGSYMFLQAGPQNAP